MVLFLLLLTAASASGAKIKMKLARFVVPQGDHSNGTVLNNIRTDIE